MAFTFDAIYAVDPNNPANVAKNASITIFDPSDPTQAPITILDPTGVPLPNPITVDAAGMGPAFQHPTLARVGWQGAGFTNYFTSYEGMYSETVAAKDAAVEAASNAGAAATADLAARIASGQFKGEKGADGASILPTDTAVRDAINNTASATRGALNAAYGTFISPMSKGAVGDGVANDYAALLATMTAAATGSVIDLGGRTFKLGQMFGITKSVTIRNGVLTCAVDRVAQITAANVRLENVQFIRTGPASTNSGALLVNAANAVLVDVTATSTYGEGLRMGNGTANGTQVRGGYYASSDPNDSHAIHLVSGASHSYDVLVSGATVRHTGYGTGVGLYNCSRSTVERCDVRSIRRQPLATITGWSLVSGTVYRALDRTDVASNAVYVNNVEYRKNADPASTTPALNYYTNPGDGYLYINTGVDPSTQTVKTTRTNGYGIMFYATSAEAVGMRDNLMAHNYVEDTDGFGLYYQTLMNIPRNNRTLQNTLRNVCLTGVTVADLPFAGIGVFGGLDVQISGDNIDGVGSTGLPVPGIDIKPSIGTPSVTGSIRGVTVKNATFHGISLCVGTWQLSDVTTSYNAGSGISHGFLVNSTDILDVSLSGCVSTYNTLNGVNFETATGDVEVQILGGRYTNNTIRNISLVRCRNVFVGAGVLSGWAGSAGINVTGTNQRVVIDGVFLRSGVGLIVNSGITDLTINNVINDGSSGTKFNVTGPYKVTGSTGFGTDWRCTGTPEGQVTAVVGSRCTRSDGGAGTTFYIKESGTGNTGWVAK